MLRFETEQATLLLLAVAMAVSGWLWAGRRMDLSRALTYVASTYPGAGLQVRRPSEAATCNVLLLQIDERRWLIFDTAKARETVAADEDTITRIVRAKLRLPETVPLQVVDAVNQAGTDGTFVAGVAVGSGLARSRWELGIDLQGCRLTAVELAQRDPLTGKVTRYPVMKPVAGVAKG